MARRANISETVNITIATTPTIKELLETIVQMGWHGRNIAEAVELLTKERVQQLMDEDDQLGEALKAENTKQAAVARYGISVEDAN